MFQQRKAKKLKIITTTKEINTRRQSILFDHNRCRRYYQYTILIYNRIAATIGPSLVIILVYMFDLYYIEILSLVKYLSKMSLLSV